MTEDTKLQATLKHFGGRIRRKDDVNWIACHHCGKEHLVDVTDGRRYFYICHGVTYVVVKGDEVFSAKRARQRPAEGS